MMCLAALPALFCRLGDGSKGRTQRRKEKADLSHRSPRAGDPSCVRAGRVRDDNVKEKQIPACGRQASPIAAPFAKAQGRRDDSAWVLLCVTICTGIGTESF